MPSDDALYAEMFGGPAPSSPLPTGPDEPPPPADASSEAVLAWAERTGRISAASRPTWESNFEAHPDQTDATLRILARAVLDDAPAQQIAAARPRAVAAVTPPASYAPARIQTASGIDVSPLPARLQAAAARVTDRAKVVTWLQRYNGAPEPEGGWLGELANQGDDDLAAAIQEDEREAASFERERLLAESVKANAAWRVSPD
nr:hypothetical protein [Actinomycetota bacterium]